METESICFTQLVEDLEAMKLQIMALIALDAQNRLRIQELMKRLDLPDCFHRYEKRTDVVYLTFPIQYRYKCVDCGHEKSGI